MNRIVVASGGFLAHIQCGLIRLTGAVTQVAGYRGLYGMTARLGRFFPRGARVIVTTPHPGAKFLIDLDDPYWARLVANPDYEPEVGALLKEFLPMPDVYFLDCGANKGYWSIVAARWMGGWDRIVTLEAWPGNAARLTDNLKLNGCPREPVIAAAWHTDGETLEMVGHEERHAGSSVVDRREKAGERGYSVERVPSVTLDTLTNRVVREPDAGVVVKLDVEGAEIAALKGSRRLLADRETLWLFEDLAQETESRVSRYFLEHLGFRVYHCRDGRVSAVAGLEEVGRIKADPRNGCNFAATREGTCFGRRLERLRTRLP